MNSENIYYTARDLARDLNIIRGDVANAQRELRNIHEQYSLFFENTMRDFESDPERQDMSSTLRSAFQHLQMAQELGKAASIKLDAYMDTHFTASYSGDPARLGLDTGTSV